MNILLTNDDGIYAPGLNALYQALSGEHQVTVVAPESEQSAVGHAITLTDPIKVKEARKNGAFFGLAVTGTPADCVRLGVSELVRPKPEAVISGINLGANVGVNILYSGTVSAATEAAIIGLPALAVSLDTFIDPDFTYAANLAARLVNHLKGLNLVPGVCLNVNVPAGPAEKIKGPVWACQCPAVAGEEFDRRLDPRGNIYYWRGRESPPIDPPADSDLALLAQGYATLTPISYDLTHRRELERLKALPLG